MSVRLGDTAGGKPVARAGFLPIERLTATGHALLGAFLVVLVSLPWWGGSYLVTVGTIVLYLALLGQSWNVMLGFAGLLSIGHALFVGTAAYAAGYLYARLGILPVLGVVPAVALAVAMGMIVGYLGFRFSIGGVYFALLTIAFAEFTRIMVDHVAFLGGTQGLFLPVTDEDRHGADLLALRGHPVMFYYVILALTFGTLALCRRLVRSKLGFYWQAIRDDPDAAQALGVNVFRYRMYAVMISSAIAGVGGVFYAFYYNVLFPESVFSIERSIEFTLAPIVGGVGTLFGPIFGAFLLTPLGEIITWAIGVLRDLGVIEPSLKLNGLKLLIWGTVVILIVLFKPHGLWPWFRDRLRLARPPGDEG